MTLSGGNTLYLIIFVRCPYSSPSEATLSFLKGLVVIRPPVRCIGFSLMPRYEPTVPLPSQPMSLAVRQPPTLAPRSGPQSLDTASYSRVPFA
ncbi:hypothetical protein ASF20_04625 [Methylobacterium sp. Leaf88]|nr:hypothetical protein ASF20_04625 [Methylobacterium sp. Leaf88]